MDIDLANDENEMRDESDDLTASLRTPECLLTDVNFFNDPALHIHHYLNVSTKSPVTSFSDVNSNSVPFTENSSEIPFYSNEWQIYDRSLDKMRRPRQNEFLRLLLQNDRYSSYVSWVDKSQGLFRILEPDRVAKLWERVKSRQTNGKMDYETFARGIRYYYGKGLMVKTNKKHTFCFKQ